MTIPEFKNIAVKDYKPEIRTLSNGIKTYCFNNKEMEVAFMKIIFDNAGTISQDKFFTAALTKTQLNQGTKDYSAMELADNLDFYGVNYAPSTSNERTSLAFSFMQQYQKDVFPLIEQMIKYPVFPQSNLQVTINNSRQEYLMKTQQTNFLAHKAFMTNLFGEDSPYGKYARVEDYDKVTPEDLKLFYQKRYSFNQCYIMLAGNIDEEFYSLLERYLGEERWNESTADISRPQIDIDFAPKYKTIYTNLPSAVQSSIAMGKLVPGIEHEDYIPLSVLNCLFGGFFNSRLMSNIREEKGYTYGIDSVLAPFKYGNIMLIVSDVTADKDSLTIEEIHKEMIRLREEKVSEEELTMVKNYMTGDMLRSTDGVADICENYEYFIRYNLREDYNSYMLKRIQSTTPEEILSLANKYLLEDTFLTSIAKKVE
ncbi:MAG: insulinase family protein [Bacteroidales bacterium]|nr:insulinase family protein [Candidatus Scybalousia scybalohippi]